MGDKVSDEITNSALNKYFSREVQLNLKDKDDSVDIAIPIIKKISEEIHRNDPRFCAQPTYIGSHAQGLKVQCADEFDVNVKLNDVDDLPCGSHFTPRYYGFNRPIDGELRTIPNDLEVIPSTVPLPNPENGYTYLEWRGRDSHLWQDDDLFMEDNLIPFLVNRHFRNLLCAAIRNLDMRVMVRKASKLRGPAIMIYINVPGHHEITVDFSVTYEDNTPWPDHISWPSKHQKWPTAYKAIQVHKAGVHCVAKKPFDWYWSFAKAENELVKDIDSDGGCRKKCHRVMKKLRDDFWCTSGYAVLTSYHLKNVLFWECQSYPSEEEWANDMISTRLISMTRYLLRCIDNYKLMQYFDETVNLFESKNEDHLIGIGRNIKQWLEEPEWLKNEE